MIASTTNISSLRDRPSQINFARNNCLGICNGWINGWWGGGRTFTGNFHKTVCDKEGEIYRKERDYGIRRCWHSSLDFLSFFLYAAQLLYIFLSQYQKLLSRSKFTVHRQHKRRRFMCGHWKINCTKYYLIQWVSL